MAKRLLDSVDCALLEALMEDGRLTNRSLASRVCVAESTCHARLAALSARGVVKGVHAELDWAAVGLGVQALLLLRTINQAAAAAEARRLARVDGVLRVFVLARDEGLALWAAFPSAVHLRSFIAAELNRSPAVTAVTTHLLSQARRGRPPRLTPQR
ncbi:MAG: Lrp/AsnC family transcriptional regulator [Propionibacteriaceae bacterium]|jgi:DNA-binding Lrp family transcriptional regulator|nr:Lrp/AsnC family transcriptional regulator [Propionibacteriaceae bacterium]